MDEEDLKQDREAGKSQFKMNIVKRRKKKRRVKNSEQCFVESTKRRNKTPKKVRKNKEMKRAKQIRKQEEMPKFNESRQIGRREKAGEKLRSTFEKQGNDTSNCFRKIVAEKQQNNSRLIKHKQPM